MFSRSWQAISHRSVSRTSRKLVPSAARWRLSVRPCMPMRCATVTTMSRARTDFGAKQAPQLADEVLAGRGLQSEDALGHHGVEDRSALAKGRSSQPRANTMAVRSALKVGAETWNTGTDPRDPCGRMQATHRAGARLPHRARRMLQAIAIAASRICSARSDSGATIS